MSLLFYAHFIKAWCNVWYCNTHFASMSTLLQHFDLITATTEKPSLHKYHVANSTRTWRALQPTSGNSARTLAQNEMSDLGLYIVFKVRSEVKSINCSASRDVNPERHLHYQQKDFFSNCTSPCLQKNISRNVFRASKCKHITVFTSHSLVFCREWLPDCEYKWDFRSGKLSHCSLFINRSVFHNCSFL